LGKYNEYVSERGTQTKLEFHVKTIGLCSILLGALNGLVSLSFFGFFDGAALLTTYPALARFGVLGLTTLMLAMAIPSIVVGVGLVRFRPWARSAGMIYAIVSLLVLPLGTILGIYMLSVLVSPETDALFNPRFNSLYIRKP
jgi:hypothetical protein